MPPGPGKIRIAQRAGDLALLAAKSCDLDAVSSAIGASGGGTRRRARRRRSSPPARCGRGVGADHRLDGVHVQHRLDPASCASSGTPAEESASGSTCTPASDEEARRGSVGDEAYAPNARGDARRTRGARHRRCGVSDVAARSARDATNIAKDPILVCARASRRRRLHVLDDARSDKGGAPIRTRKPDPPPTLTLTLTLTDPDP